MSLVVQENELQSARSVLRSDDFAAVWALKTQAEAFAHAAEIAKAREQARQANEIRIRAERRLGQLIRSSEQASAIGVSGSWVSVWRDLAAIPDELFETTIHDMLRRDKKCAPDHVIVNASRGSLRAVEPGIKVDWKGEYWVEVRGNYRRSVYPTLDMAREDLQRMLGLRKHWSHSKERERLDDAHARARRLSQSLNLLGQTALAPAAYAKVEEAELLVMKAAEALYDAYVAHLDQAYEKRDD